MSAYKSSFKKSVASLVENASDANEAVREQIISALVMLSRKDFGSVLDVLATFLKENGAKATPTHQRITLLAAIKRVTAVHDDQVSDELVKRLLEVAYTDMVAGMDVSNPWQLGAAETVSGLMCAAPGVCIPQVASNIPGTALPNYFILHSLARAAEQDAHHFVPHLKDVMAKVLPILGLAKQENARYNIADALAAMGRAILVVFGERKPGAAAAAAAAQASEEDASLEGAKRERSLDTPRSGQCKRLRADDFHETMYTALSFLVNDWAGVKDPKIRTTVALAMGTLSGVISTAHLEERLPVLVKLLTGALKKEKPKDVLLPLQGVSAFLRTAAKRTRQELLPQMEEVWKAVFAQVVLHTGVPPTEQAELTKMNAEAMLCVEMMCMACTQTVLNYIQAVLDSKSGSKDPITRCAALQVLIHIVQADGLEDSLAVLKNNVVAVVKTTLEDSDYRTRKAIVQTILTMGGCSKNNYLACEGGSDLVHYLISTAALQPHVCADWVAKNKKLAESGAHPTPEQVKETSVAALTIFHTQFTHLDTVLWPFLLEMLGQLPTMPQLLNIFPQLCRAMVDVSTRLGNTHEFYFDFDQQVNVPKPEALVPVFCVMLSQHDHNGKDDTLAILRCMECLAPLLDEPMKRTHDGTTPVGSLWLGLLPDMRDYIESEEFKQEDFEEACHTLVKKTCTAKKEESWVQALTTKLGEHLGVFAHSSIPPEHLKELHDYKRVALSMFGLMLSKANMKSFVTDSLKVLADATDHTNETQRQGAARGFGAAAAAHCDLVLEKLSKMTKAKGGGGGGFFGKKADTGAGEKDYGDLGRATVLLSFGHVAKKANHSIFSSRMETLVVPTTLDVLQSPAAKLPSVRIAALAGLSMVMAALKKNDPNFSFASKQQMVLQIAQLMQIDPAQYAATNDTVANHLMFHGLGALTSVLFLKPALEPEARDTVICAVSAGICKEWKGLDEKAKKGDPLLHSLEPVPEKELQKQLGLLCNSLFENGDEHVGSLAALGSLLAEFMRDPVAVRRERATKAYVVLLKHFGKTCDTVGFTIPLCEAGPADEEDEPVAAPGFLVPAFDAKGRPEPPKPSDAQQRLSASFAASFAPKKDSKKDDKAKRSSFTAESSGLGLSFGAVLARLLPRLSDGSLKTKTDALDGVSFCTKLCLLTADQHGHPNGVPASDYQQALETLKAVGKRGLAFADEGEVVVAMKEVTQALCCFMRSTLELSHLIDGLVVHGLLDPEDGSSVAVCCILSGLFKGLAGSAENLSDEHVQLLLRKMVSVLQILFSAPGDVRKDAKRGTMLAIKALAKNRPALVFNELHTYPVPHSQVLVQVMQTVANDTGLAKLAVSHCLDVMLNSQLYNETYVSGGTMKGDKLSLVHAVISSATAVGEVCQTAKGSEVAKKSFRAPILGALLLVLSAAHEAPHHAGDTTPAEVKDKKKAKELAKQRALAKESWVPPAPLAVDAIRAFTQVVFPEAFERASQEFWAALAQDGTFAAAASVLLMAVVHDAHPDGDKDVTNKAKRACLSLGHVDVLPVEQATMVLPPTTPCPLVEELFAFINPYISKVYDSQRRCALIVSGQLLYHSLGDKELTKGIVNSLLSRSGQDEQFVIKMQATVGFKHLPQHGYDGIKHYVAPSISALVSCCGDVYPDVIVSAMRTLESLFLRMTCRKEISAVAVNVCLKTKSAIDHSCPPIRAAACSLFRVMCGMAVDGVIDGETLDPNVYTHVPSVLCHVHDADAAVARSAKECLQAVGAYIRSAPPSKKAADSLRRLLELDHVQPGAETRFDDFAHDFSRVWMKHFAARGNDLVVAMIAYYQSSFPEVRAAAAVFVGFLMKFLPDSDQARSNLESGTIGLTNLLKKDPSPEVRLKAAKAMGHLGEMA